MKNKKGFTLLELLIVISIIAILSVALVLILNPAETLKKSRDAQRISDLNTIKTALGLYLTSTSTPYLGGDFTDGACGTKRTSTSTTEGGVAVNGATTNWIPVNLNALISGSPISSLPLDPVNSGDYAYWYRCEGATKSFEISAKLESTEYKTKGSTDGGNELDTERYEVGTKLSL